VLTGYKSIDCGKTFDLGRKRNERKVACG